jgi:hypothetical protein
VSERETGRARGANCDEETTRVRRKEMPRKPSCGQRTRREQGTLALQGATNLLGDLLGHRQLHPASRAGHGRDCGGVLGGGVGGREDFCSARPAVTLGRARYVPKAEARPMRATRTRTKKRIFPSRVNCPCLQRSFTSRAERREATTPQAPSPRSLPNPTQSLAPVVSEQRRRPSAEKAHKSRRARPTEPTGLGWEAASGRSTHGGAVQWAPWMDGQR